MKLDNQWDEDKDREEGRMWVRNERYSWKNYDEKDLDSYGYSEEDQFLNV